MGHVEVGGFRAAGGFRVIEAAVRAVGAAIAGLVVGLLAGLAVVEVIARSAVDDDGHLPDSVPLALALGVAPLLLAGGGIVVGLVVERRLRRS